MLPVQMRTTFSGIYLFNDDDFKAQHISIFNGKGWAES